MNTTVDALLSFIAQDGCSDAEFDALALRLFAQQHAGNAAFRRFCQARGASWGRPSTRPFKIFRARITCSISSSHSSISRSTTSSHRAGRPMPS